MNSKNDLLKYLKQNYENIDHPLYFSGITKIFEFFKGKLSIRDIEDFLSSNQTYTTFRQWKKPNPRNPTFVHRIRFQFQADTVEISKIKNWNKGYCYILTCIDIWSRKAFCRLMKRKTAEETVSCMRDIFNEAINPPQTILFDRGSELRNRLMNSLLKKLNIEVYSSDTSIHAPFVERFNYTIQVLLTFSSLQ